MRVDERAVGNPVAADGVLQDCLLLQQIGLRDQQVLLADVHLSFGARHFDGRERSGLGLFPVVFEQLFSGRQFALPGAHILPELHQIPIQIQNR